MSLRVLSYGVVFSVVFLLASTALAQRNNNPAMQRMQNMQPIKTGGTLITATPSQLQISTNTNQTMYVIVMPNTQISVTGTAEQDYLKSGVTVEFVAEVAKGGAVKDKISHLVVVTPTTERPVGLYPPESAAPDKKGDENAKPKGADAGLGDAPPAKGRKSHGKKETDPLGGDASASKPGKGHGTAPQFPGTFSVRGTIKLCKNGAISVAAGHGPTIKGELASDVTIDVDMADLRAAQRDDKVTVSGKCSQARPNMVMAESITIELANPLSGTKKHAAHAKTPAARAGKAKKGAADGDDLLGGGK